MSKKCGVGSIFYVLTVIGGINWGLVGLGMLMGKMMEWNIVHMLLGSWPMVEGIVYLLVGVSAVVSLFGGCKCETCKMPEMPKTQAPM